MDGVDVWRTKVVLPRRLTATSRIVFDSSIGFTSALTTLSIPRVDVAICLSPPIQTTLAAAIVRFKMRKLVVFVQDLPTEAARSVGILKEGPALSVGRSLEHLAYRLADHVVVIANAFRKYIEGVGVNPGKISEIPNWADVESIRPQRPDQVMRERLGASRSDFLVVHAGNMGAKQDLLNVVAAAAALQEDSHIKFALIGDGQHRDRVSGEIAARHLSNIRVMPLRANDEFSAVLGAADALLVNQAPMVVDSVLPSKLLAYMASERPVVVSAHLKSTTADLVRTSGCGVVAHPGQPDALAAAIRAMASADPLSTELATMATRGRAYVEEHFGRASILKRWDVLLADLAGTS